MKTLFVGDVHATTSDLEDCVKLVDLIEETLRCNKVDYLVFLGDQTHNHAIVNINVLDFWKGALTRLRPLVLKETIVLVGNHDLPGNTGDYSINSMSVFDGLARIVTDPQIIEGVLYLGYQYSNEEFVAICNEYSHLDTVVCHATFQGAQYENGMYCSDGIEISVLPKNQTYISGHIHTPSEFGPVIYIGAPRWRSVSDAPVLERNLRLAETGNVREYKNIPTSSHVKKVVVLDVTPDNCQSFLINAEPANKDVYHYNLIGPQMWIDEVMALFRQKGMVKTVSTDSRPVEVRESEGIDKALERFVDSAVIKTPKETIKRMVEERIWKRGPP